MRRPTDDDMKAVQELIGSMMANEREAQTSSEAMGAVADYINERHEALTDRIRLAMFMALAVPTVDSRYSFRECVEASTAAYADVVTYIAMRDASPARTVH